VNVTDVLDQLDGVKRTRRGWSTRCPAHRDRSPSLSIAEGTDDGRLLFHCFSGCTYHEIVAALGIERPRTVRRLSDSTIFATAHAMARRQPWAKEGVRRLYQHADAVRRCHRLGGPFEAIADAWEADPDLYWQAVPR
jgi:CHC2 zinc finger